MARMLPQVATAAPWTRRAAGHGDERRVHVRRAVGAGAAPRGAGRRSPTAFRDGMAARAEQLGDRGPSAPSEWEAGLGTGDAHVLVTVYAVDGEHLRAAVASVIGEDAEQRAVDARAPAARRGAARRARPLRLLRRHRAARGARAPASSRGPATASPTARAAGATWPPARSCSATRTRTARCRPRRCAPFERNGTFVVYRKLAMDTAAFRRFVAGAELPGRRRPARGEDRRPLAGRHAARALPRLARTPRSGDPRRINDFGYDDDPGGLKCPLGAHIRRANPRDSSASSTAGCPTATGIVRRGRAYGKPLPPGVVEDDGVDRGLVFVCFQADIWRQFETDPGALDRRRRSVRARPRQGLPGRRAARHRGQDDDPGPPAALPQAAAAVRDAARRRVPVPAVDERPAAGSRARRRRRVLGCPPSLSRASARP